MKTCRKLYKELIYKRTQVILNQLKAQDEENNEGFVGYFPEEYDWGTEEYLGYMPDDYFSDFCVEEEPVGLPEDFFDEEPEPPIKSEPVQPVKTVPTIEESESEEDTADEYMTYDQVSTIANAIHHDLREMDIAMKKHHDNYMKRLRKKKNKSVVSA
jgi:hypothetical protein